MKDYDLVYGFYKEFDKGRIKLQCEVVIDHLTSPSKKDAILFCAYNGYSVSLFVCEEKVIVCFGTKEIKLREYDNADVNFFMLSDEGWQDEINFCLNQEELKQLPEWRLSYCEHRRGFTPVDLSIHEVYQKLYAAAEKDKGKITGTTEKEGYELIKNMFFLKECN